MRRWQEMTGDAGLTLMCVFVELPSGDYLAPDVAWWSPARRPTVGEGPVEAAPDVVVDVVSSRTRTNDVGVKRDLYLAAGRGARAVAGRVQRAQDHAHARR